MRTLTILAVALVTLLSTTAVARTGPRVLVIWDSPGEATDALVGSLKGSGFRVTRSATNESSFDGTNPSLREFDVAIHMNGTTFATEMPVAGQEALERFVRNGGGYIHHEWNAYQLSVGQLKKLRPLILFDRVSGHQGSINLKKVEGSVGHPVVWEVPKVFQMTGGANIGKIHVFAEEPAMVLARDQQGNDAIAIREYGLGRVVGFHHAGNWVSWTPNLDVALNSRDAQRLFVDGVRWAYGCEKGFREGRREKLCAEIAKRRRR